MFVKEDFTFILNKLKEKGFTGDSEYLLSVFEENEKEIVRKIPLMSVISALTEMIDYVTIKSDDKFYITEMLKAIKEKSNNNSNKFNAGFKTLQEKPFVEFKDDQGNFSIYGIYDEGCVSSRGISGELSIYEVHGQKEDGIVFFVSGHKTIVKPRTQLYS